MSSLMNLIDQGEMLTLIFIIAVLYYVGQLAIADNQRLKNWGFRFALLTLSVYVLFESSRHGVDDATTLLAIMLRGLILAGMMLGMSWIVLSAFDFLFAPLGWLNGLWRATVLQWQYNSRQKQNERDEEKHRRHELNEWNRRAPEREQQHRKQQEAEAQRRSDQCQREEVRLKCQLLYDQHASALQEHFPRERLREYFEQYLTDAFPPHLVEMRAELLKEMILASLEGTGKNGKRFASLNDIAAHFQVQRQEIELLKYDDQTRQTMLSSLNEQEDRTIREFLSS